VVAWLVDIDSCKCVSQQIDLDFEPKMRVLRPRSIGLDL